MRVRLYDVPALFGCDIMVTTTYIDSPVPVSFTLPRNGTVGITTQEYVSLMTYARDYTVGSGKSAHTFNLVHTTAGYVSIHTRKSGAAAVWAADDFTVKSVVADGDGNHFAEIDTGCRIVRLPFESFLPLKIDAALFNKGIAVSKANKAHEALSMHLQWLFGQFEVGDAKQILGWRYSRDKLIWTGSNSEPPLLRYSLQFDAQEAYVEQLNHLINGCFGLQFALCTAAASTLQVYLHMTAKLPVIPFGLSLVGLSSTGKTSALQLAASLYSAPDDPLVYTGFNGTQGALLSVLKCHNGVPLCYDESTIDNGMSKSSFVYKFADGCDRLRLNQDSQLKERETWLCTALFSSETPLVDLTNNDNLGLGVRILNLENTVYTRNAEHADEVKTFAATNYGIVGNLLSDFLLNADQTEVLNDYNEVRSLLGSMEGLQRCSLTDRLLTNLVIVLHTAAILAELGIQIDLQEMCNICVQINNKVAEDADPAKNIITKIFGYINSKYQYLKGIKWTTAKDGTPTKVAIVETTFAEILHDCGITDIKGAVNRLDDANYIIRQSKNRVKSKLSIDGSPCYAYQLDMNKVRDAFGSIDDTFSNVKKYQCKEFGTDEVLDIVHDEEAIIHEGNYKIECNKTAVGGKAVLL